MGGAFQHTEANRGRLSRNLKSPETREKGRRAQRLATERAFERMKGAILTCGESLLRGEVTVEERGRVRHEEPPFNEEIAAIQDKMVARFGKHEGRKPVPIVTEFRTLQLKYGMEICSGCGKLKDIDFTCVHCDNGDAVVTR